MTLASFPSITATTEFVVPRSIPMIFSPRAISKCSFSVVRSSHGAVAPIGDSFLECLDLCACFEVFDIFRGRRKTPPRPDQVKQRPCHAARRPVGRCHQRNWPEID